MQTAAGTLNPPGDVSATDNGHLSGTGTPGATVNVYVDGRLVNTVVVDADGNWSCDLPLMTAGAHSVSIGITGSAGEEVFRSGDEKAVLQLRSFPMLDEVAGVMAAHPEVKLVNIEGHTDDRGSAAANLALSLARAQSVKAYLVGKGVAAERLGAHGNGPTRPIADNAMAEGREKNRRVEFIVFDAE